MRKFGFKSACFAALVLGLALSGGAAGQSLELVNKALPRWLQFSGEERVRVEGWSGLGYQLENRDLFALNRFRINMQVTPARWLKFLFQGQDSRVSGENIKPAPASHKDALDLRLGWVEIGEAEKSPVLLRVGRQSLKFGDGRLVADPNWGNTGRSFDAVAVTLRRGKARVDVFAASVVRVKDGEFNRRVAGDNFHGAYGSLGNLVPKATVEPFVFWRVAPAVRAESGARGKLDSKTAGVRWVGKLPLSFDYNVEVAAQTGRWAGDRIGAWAGHFVAGYTFPKARLRPRAFAEYNYASGDRDPLDGRRGTFDQLYPSAHDKFGLADQFMWSNLRHGRAGFEMQIRTALALASSFHSFRLASSRDGLYAPGAKLVARSNAGAAGSRIGSEFDIQAAWKAGAYTQLEFGYARIFPGAFLREMTPAAGQNCFFVSLAQRF